ncbi:ferredoxin--nitrite reductase [Caminibacter sp.]
MINILQKAKEAHSKKINKIEKIKALSSSQEALERLKSGKLEDIDRDYFLKCFGCFYKKNTNDYMIRVRVKGSLTPLQAKKVGEIAKNFGKDYIDLTTRMQIELRFIKEENLFEVLSLLDEAGITTYQTGVDNFRGILYDPFAGISKESILNDLVLRDRLEEEIIGKDVCALPRKFNIGICGNIKNTSNVFTQDLGFVLAKRDGKIGYRVFMGGRVGMIGQDSNVFVNEDEAVKLFRGVRELFKTYGFRDNRNKNRFAFLLKEVGLNNFIKALEDFLEIDLKKGGEILTSEKINTSLKENLVNGKEAYKFIVPAGIFSGSDMIEAGKLADEFDGEIKLSYDQNFYITNANETITKSDLYKKYPPNPFKNHMVACAGIKTCAFGVIENKEDAIKLAEELERAVSLDGIVKFHWSACVKGCGIHGVGDFGFEGAKVRTKEGMKQGVHIFIGGNSKKEGKKVLSVPLREVFIHILPIIKLYNERKDRNLTYEEWFEKQEINEWAVGFIMKWNAKVFEFLPSLPLKSKKIEMFEIKEIGNKLFYQLTKINAFDDLFMPLKVHRLKDFGFKGKKEYEIIDKMVSGKYQVWSEVLIELEGIDG